MGRQRSILNAVADLARAESALEAAGDDISVAVRRLLARNYAIGMAGCEGMPARIRNFEMVAASVDPGSDRNSRFAIDILEALESVERNGISAESVAEAFRLSDRTNIYSRKSADASVVEADALVVASIMEEHDVEPSELAVVISASHSSRRRSRMARLCLPRLLGSHLGMRNPVYDRKLVSPSSADDAENKIDDAFLDRIGAYAERVAASVSRLKSLRTSAERKFRNDRTDSRVIDVYAATFRHPVATPRIIAAVCGMTTRGASLTLDKLEREDLISRMSETTLARKIYVSEKILVDL